MNLVYSQIDMQDSSIIQKFKLFKLFIILARNGKDTMTVITIINIMASTRSGWYDRPN